MVSTVSTFVMSGTYLHNLCLKRLIRYFVVWCEANTSNDGIHIKYLNEPITSFSPKLWPQNFVSALTMHCVFRSGNAWHRLVRKLYFLV